MWRPIADFEGYEVSDQGQVRSVDRYIASKSGVMYWVPGKVLVPHLSPEGLLVVRIQRKRRRIHLLVKEAFHGMERCCRFRR